MMRSRARTLLAIGVLAAGAMTALAQPASQGLITRGAPPDLFMLYSGDVIGYLGPCG